MQQQPFNMKAAHLLNQELIEDQFALSTKENSELEALYAKGPASFKTGELCTGSVLTRDSDGFIIDIGYKSYGNIGLGEFNSEELKQFQVGAAIEVLIDRLEDENGNVVLSYQKAKSLKAWDRIVNLAKEDEPVTGVVTHKVKGGLNVDIGIPAFLPGSQIDMQRVNDFDAYLGQEVMCKILKVNKRRGNVIISRRRYLEAERQEAKSKVMGTLEEGQIMEGVAKNITNYGVFVDIGGVDGLLHITDMSWGRVGHPSELLNIGDKVTVKVIGLDRDHEKISLGLKQLSENPWDNVETQYPIGERLKGKISSITDYGLFVEIAKGIEGLVHISEVSWTERITNLNKHYQVGQDIDVVVVALDKGNRRMSLSIKQMTEDPWQLIAAKYKVGEKISGHISNVTDFGVFVELSDGVDGLVHVSDISWTDHITNPGDRYKKGEPLDAMVLAMDTANKKISLGIKQLSEDPWVNVESRYPIGDVVEGTVSKITSFGAFVRLEDGIEGLVHTSELPRKEKDSDAAEELAIGTTREFKVIKVNSEDRKLGLSIKALTESASATAERSAPAARAPRKRPQGKDAAPRTATSTGASSMRGVLQQALEEHAARMGTTEDKPAAQADDAATEDKKDNE